MNLISPTELARIIEQQTGEPFTRQAVHKAIDEGLIPFTLQGKKKLVDTDDPNVQSYIRDSNRQREQAKKNDIRTVEDLKNIIVPEERGAIDEVLKKMPQLEKALIDSANKILSEKKKQKPSKPKIPSKLADEIGTDIEGLSDFDIKQKIKLADMRIKEARANHAEKKLVATEFVQNYLFKYIENLNSNIERIAAVQLKEVGKSIIEEGEVKPAHITKFTNQVLEVIHLTKKNIIRELEKYEPKTGN